MQRAVLFAAILLCAASVDASGLAALSGRDVQVVTRLRGIEPGAVTALKRQFRDTDRRLADRGAGFEATDALGPENFPQRRLVLAAHAGDTWFIHYEHGGYGLHSHLVGLARSGSSWRVVYSGSAFYAYDTLPKLREAIRRQQFRLKSNEL
jgi:hypothetical protein